jgi:hypothetical protein
LSLDTWYHVSFNHEYIYRKVYPPGRQEWNDKLRWDNIIRVCYKLGDYLIPDELYLFTNKREESYLIPFEADGAQKLWGEILEKKLFDAKLAIEILSKTEGVYCWPEED